jgi:hypothetical protein
MAYKEIIEKRLRILGFDKQTLDTLKNIQTILEPSIDHILDLFYEQIRHDEEIVALFSSQESYLAARRAQKEHWIDILFSGDIGKVHFENAERIGKTHERIGLSLGNYLAGYCLMMNQFLRVISDHFHDDNIGMTQMIQALNKAAFLDIDSVIDSYLEAKDKALQKVLKQAQQFTSDLKEVNNKIGDVAIDHQNYLSLLLKKTESFDRNALELEQKVARVKLTKPNNTGESNLEMYTLLEACSALLKSNRDNHADIANAEQQAKQLTDQINNLNPRYEKLQNEHKCRFIVDKQLPMASE